ncbi:low temperature requirement protein A [Micromonospora sp. NPDC048930]|uniref:low temperature requirement protein A n=1 Tax=Micromonospora sp. NPDC048930 TaxID=3364261 RepID=UPI00371C9773
MFFGLVFVFAFVQVTNLMADDFTAHEVLNGLLALTLLWWAWSISAWIANRVRADFGLTRTVVRGARNATARRLRAPVRGGDPAAAAVPPPLADPRRPTALWAASSYRSPAGSSGLKKIFTSSGAGRFVSLHGLAVYVLYGGVALFLLSHVAFQLRITRLFRTIIWPRLTVAALLIALIPILDGRRAVLALGLLAACCVLLVVVEVIVADGQRRRLREETLMHHADEETEMGTGWSHPGGR